ncbi:hypothetical protein N657DRAFT_675881 [Parathielavia appendiculata]|uniref:HORMA domain-containing protein n=1 Tax=Parathielavia appendiculata TaxID=2587402 RepID=A0AAN6UAK0_9PEZI|nr:hypothetical protein N657DRAFT_675881 [Parathielavia appendiculata]
MAKRPSASYAVCEPPPKRDLELCKVVFGAAISQILYSRRALPPECFQLLPVAGVVSRSFEDIVASGSGIHTHDKEILREQAHTVYFRQTGNYGLNRFLGILEEDIFPLIENEALVKFRISFLRTKAWGEKSLVEYYTVAFKYEHNGVYILDIWRAGMGIQHAATTDSQLWDLGDYLSRLPSWTEPMHWTLAFHATERPDDPPIGVWKFDRSDFDDANLDLQQRDGYAYTRVTRLEIMPLPLVGMDRVIRETSHDSEPEVPVHKEPSSKRPKTSAASRAEKKRKKTQNSAKGVVRFRASKAAQPSPPITAVSSRNVSKNHTVERVDEEELMSHNKGKEASLGAECGTISASRKGPGTKRKPKRPLQLFEYAASSLPPTQIIGESQPLSQKADIWKAGQSHNSVNGVVEEEVQVPRSPSFDPFPLLDGISLTTEAVSVTQGSPGIGLPLHPRPHANSETSMDGFEGLLRFSPSYNVAGKTQGLSQWELRASPPGNLLGISASDDKSHTDAASDAPPETVSRASKDRNGEKGITYDFEPSTVARRTSLFHGLPCSSGGEVE